MSHQIDTVHWFTGLPHPRSAVANGGIYQWHDGRQNFDLVNVGLTASKTLKFADSDFPVSATTMWNPSTGIARVQLAVTLF